MEDFLREIGALPPVDLHCGDAIDVLRGLPSGSAHCCVTDPPYGERAAARDSPRGQDWHEQWLREAARVVVADGPFIVFGSRRYLDFLWSAMRTVLGDTPARPLQSGVWVHRQGFCPRGGYLRPEHEPFVVSGLLRATADDVRSTRRYLTPHNVSRKPTHRRKEQNGFRAHTYTPNASGPMGGTVVEAARNKPKEATGHPTQKPVEVMLPLVMLACPSGGTVLDPFIGSGTTGVAAAMRARGFVGVDLNADYVSTATARLLAAQGLT